MPPTSSARAAPRANLAPFVVVFCGLLALVMFFYAGRTFSIDEQSALATADSLARFGRADSNLLAFTHWDLPPPAGLGRFGPDGEYYSKKTPGVSFLAAPLVWLALRLPWLGGQYAALLAPALITALAGTLVYILAVRVRRGGAEAGSGRESGARREAQAIDLAALIPAALFTGGSLALVYSRTLFTEPLAMTGVALAMLGAQDGQKRSAGFAWCGLGMAMAISANLVYLTLSPVFALFAVFPWDARAAARRLLAFGLPVAGAVALIAAYNTARFGTPLASGYHFDAGEGFTTPLWLGLYGLLLSPARGLLWFTPLSLLALPGWAMWRRAHTPQAWLALAVFGWHAAVFAGWWSWAGGVSWGPRFLLPALPVIALGWVPVVEAARARPGWRAALGLFAALSLAVQIVGATGDLNRIEAELSALSPWTPDAPPGYNHGWNALTRPALSPIAIAARQMFTGPVQIAWLRDRTDWLALALLAGVIVAAAWLTRRPHLPSWAALALAGWTVVVINLTLARLPHEPQGGAGQPLPQLSAAMAGRLPGDVLLSLTPDLTWAMLDAGPRPPVYGLPRAAGPDDSAARAAFDAALRRARRAWLLTYDPPPDSWYVTALLEAGGELIYDEQVDGYRLRVYAMP